MTLNSDLPPELEQYLLQEVEQQGLSVEAVYLTASDENGSTQEKGI